MRIGLAVFVEGFNSGQCLVERSAEVCQHTGRKLMLGLQFVFVTLFTGFAPKRVAVYMVADLMRSRLYDAQRVSDLFWNDSMNFSL